jgi:hypothetical protein
MVRKGQTLEKERVMDPFGHPDLEQLGRAMRDRLDDTLVAEQSAARAAARRRRSFRDLLLEAEDRNDDGNTYRGLVEAVGVDHVVLIDAGRTTHITIGHVVSMVTI